MARPKGHWSRGATSSRGAPPAGLEPGRDRRQARWGEGRGESAAPSLHGVSSVRFGTELVGGKITPMETKHCSGCGETKPLTADFFYHKTPGGSFRSRCKPCESARVSRRYHEREGVRVAVIKLATAWRKANRERYRELQRASRLRHLAEARARNKATRLRLQSSPPGRLRLSLGGRIRELKRTRGLHPDISVDQSLGCTWAELVAKLEAAWQPGMSWDNYGSWHVDHRKALATFELTDLEQVLVALHHSNLQPLWAHENQRKGARAA